MTQSNTDYSDLAAQTTTNGDLSTDERETSIGFARSDDRATVYSEEAAICKRLLMHPEFELQHYSTSHPDRVQQRVSAEEYNEEGHDQRKPVYGIKGTIPIGALKVTQHSRKGSGHASVVTGSYIEGLED